MASFVDVVFPPQILLSFVWCCLLALNGEENPEIPVMLVSVVLLMPWECEDAEPFEDVGATLRGC